MKKKHEGIPDQFYTPRWVKRAFKAPAKSELVVLQGSAEVKLLEKTPVKWLIQVNAYSPCYIAISQYYYPGWEISMDSQKPEIPEILPIRGLMTFYSPAGVHEFKLSFGMTWHRKFAFVLAFLGILGLTGMIFCPFSQGTRK